jgi:hypothetical protein
MGRYGVSRISYNLSYMPDKEKAVLRSGRRHFRFALIRGAGLPAPLAWVTSSSRSQTHPEGSGGHVPEPALSGIPPAARIAATGCCTQVAAGVARRHRHPGVAPPSGSPARPVGCRRLPWHQRQRHGAEAGTDPRRSGTSTQKGNSIVDATRQHPNGTMSLPYPLFAGVVASDNDDGAGAGRAGSSFA